MSILLRSRGAAVASLLWLLSGSGASAITLDWVTVGAPGNACDPQIDPGTQTQICVGAVARDGMVATDERYGTGFRLGQLVPAPEPGTGALIGLGLIGLALRRWRP